MSTNSPPRCDANSWALGCSLNPSWTSCTMSCWRSFSNTIRLFFLHIRCPFTTEKILHAFQKFDFYLYHMRLLQDVLYFSQSFFTFLNWVYVFIFHFFRNWSLLKQTFEQCYNGFVIWEHFIIKAISLSFIFLQEWLFPGGSHYLLINNDRGSTIFQRNFGWGSNYFWGVKINCYTGVKFRSYLRKFRIKI